MDLNATKQKKSITDKKIEQESKTKTKVTHTRIKNNNNRKVNYVVM